MCPLCSMQHAAWRAGLWRPSPWRLTFCTLYTAAPDSSSQQLSPCTTVLADLRRPSKFCEHVTPLPVRHALAASHVHQDTRGNLRPGRLCLYCCNAMQFEMVKPCACCASSLAQARHPSSQIKQHQLCSHLFLLCSSNKAHVALFLWKASTAGGGLKLKPSSSHTASAWGHHLTRPSCIVNH